MDILDIDEALKDDSYIFLADKTHDDISNILQQWKTNNQPLPLSQPPHLPAQHLQYNNEQAYKLNSKTFTRPKRRSLETQFAHTQNATPLPPHPPGSVVTPLLQLEIGGLVSSGMHKSFLQDTSPPSSICSSMNTERMNNSLITSADFTNLNFLQSTQSIEPDFNLTTTLTADCGYSLSDMIRDRKALESLTMSGDDGTLIKDSHIGQFDDISLTTLSKTASGCSTMDNSTDSVSTTNNEPQRSSSSVPHRTLVLAKEQEEMIGDTTFSLVDSLSTPTIEKRPVEMEIETETETQANVTFKAPQAPQLDETWLLMARQVNTTYTEGLSGTPEARCETPENVDKKLAALHLESSTPLTTAHGRQYHNNNNNINNNNNKQQYTPTLKGLVAEVNLSPIVGSETPQKTATGRFLNNTYEPAKQLAASSFDGNKFVMETMELLEQIEQPLDGTYNMAEQTEQEQLAMQDQHKQMQCVMDLAEAEVELLAQQGDEEQFEHMLAELGKVNEANGLEKEQIKMRKSLDSIKRRFNNNSNSSGGQEEHPHPHPHSQPLNVTLELKTADANASSPMMSSHSSSGGGGNPGSGERLLSRRSRLYDDVNLSAMQASGGSGNSSCNSTSFIVQRKEKPAAEAATDDACSPLEEEQQEQEQTEGGGASVETEAASYKLAERRERDRERFKTIKITKEMRDEQQQIIVPCIDDDEEQQVELELEQPEQQSQQRLSRRERAETNNYLTYKKPKEKAGGPMTRRQLPEVHNEATTAGSRPEPRSLSRPRYISGLQKFTTVSKAMSAGAGLNFNVAPAAATSAAPLATTARSAELKSPMGIKSKSFHNLSSNIGGGLGMAAAPRGSLGGGLRRPGSRVLGGMRAPQQQQELQEDASVFKVPKLVGGLRAPASAAKRAVGNGLARPSSGYYSLSVTTKATNAEAETPESLSSASSRGSLYGKESSKPNGGGSSNNFDSQALTSKLTQVTTGATGIPKPSGLRQPTQMKRSALPRPASIVRR